MRKLVLSEEKKKVIFWGLTTCLSLMIGIYVYSLNTAVFNVAKRGAIEKNISDLHNSVASLESKYISLKKDISLDLAYSLGYRDIESTIIIPRKSVSLNNAQGLTSTE